MCFCGWFDTVEQCKRTENASGKTWPQLPRPFVPPAQYGRPNPAETPRSLPPPVAQCISLPTSLAQPGCLSHAAPVQRSVQLLSIYIELTERGARRASALRAHLRNVQGRRTPTSSCVTEPWPPAAGAALCLLAGEGRCRSGAGLRGDRVCGAALSRSWAPCPGDV